MTAAAANSEATEKLSCEIAEVRAQAESDRVEYQLTLAGARNVKAARALLDDHGGDAEKLKAVEPWLFGGEVSKLDGSSSDSTGLPNAGTTKDSDRQLKHFFEVAGVVDDKEKQQPVALTGGETTPHRREKDMPKSIEYTRNYTSAIDRVYQCAGVSTVLNSGPRVVRSGRNAKEIMIPKIEVTGLGDYAPNVDYKTGAITYEFETNTFNYDRHIRLFADVKDSEEADVSHGEPYDEPKELHHGTF